jgi:hypothetical protein
MMKSMWTLQVLVNDRPVTEYNDDTGEVWIEGRKSSEYKLSFRNMSLKSVEAVFSVDGLNILTGDTDFTRGYLAKPYETIIIPGWRKDADGVAKFIFSDISKSYSERAGKGTSNVGVIGVRVFEEKPKPIFQASYNIPNWGMDWQEQGGTSVGGLLRGLTPGNANVKDDGHDVITASSFTAKADGTPFIGFMTTNTVAKAEEKVGTGWGDHSEFKTVKVEFDAQPNPSATLIMYYDTFDNLKARGIIKTKPVEPVRPNAFPSDGCPPPKY